LSLIIGKLNSQTLLFGLAMALVATGFASVNSAQTHRPMFNFLLLLFATTLAAHLGLERKCPKRGRRNRERVLQREGALVAGCAVPHAADALSEVTRPTEARGARSGRMLTAELAPSPWGPGAVALVRGVHAP